MPDITIRDLIRLRTYIACMGLDPIDPVIDRAVRGDRVAMLRLLEMAREFSSCPH